MTQQWNFPEGTSSAERERLVEEYEARLARQQVATRLVADAAARGLLGHHDREQKAVFQIVIRDYIEDGFCSADTDYLGSKASISAARASRALTLFSDQGLAVLCPQPPHAFVRIAMGPWFADEAEELRLCRAPDYPPLYVYEGVGPRALGRG